MNPDSRGRLRLRHETQDTSRSQERHLLCVNTWANTIFRFQSVPDMCRWGNITAPIHEHFCWKMFRSDKDLSAISDQPLLAAGLAGLGCIKK